MNIGVVAADDVGMSLLGCGWCREKSQLCHMARHIPAMGGTREVDEMVITRGT